MQERDIQDWLVSLINEQKLLSKIHQQDRVESIVKSIRASDQTSLFTVDYLMRKKSALAAETVLDRLSYLEIISADKSISRTTGASLRPDIVAYNSEKNAFVVFELKKDKRTAREAITELLAYEHEIQNHFPFTSSLDITFVLITREWTDIIDHALAGLNTWSSKKVLGLYLDTEDKDWHLEVRLPTAWHRLKSIGLPENALSTITLCLYPGDYKTRESGDELPPQVISAMSLIAHAGDRSQSHGFAMLWKDSHPLSPCRWFITIAAINPIAFFNYTHPYTEDARQSQFTKFFKERYSDVALIHSKSLFEICDIAKRHLNNWWNARFEIFSNWETDKGNLRERSEPVYFEFWGEIGDYVREFITHPGTIQAYPAIQENGFDWKDPLIAIPLLDDLTGQRPLRNGILNCAECFNLGVLFGVSYQISQSLNRKETDPVNKNPEWLKCISHWQNYRIIATINEINYLLRAKKETIDSPPSLYIGDSSKSTESTGGFINWLLKNLIGDDHPKHQHCFILGSIAAPLFDNTLSKFVDDTYLKEIVDQISISYDQIVATILSQRGSNWLDDEANSLFKSISEEIGDLEELSLNDLPSDEQRYLLKMFPRLIIPLCDKLLPPVWHDITTMSPQDIDWEDYKMAAISLFKSGERYPAVILHPNGMLGVGRCGLADFVKNAPIEDPTRHIFFWNRLPGLSTVKTVTWSELENGSAFRF